MNKCIFNGRLVKDVELRFTKDGLVIAKGIIAVYRDKEKGDFLNFTSFSKTAETIAKYFKKGDGINLVCRLQNANYKKDGKTIYQNNLIVENFGFPVAKKSKTDLPVEGDNSSIPDNEESPF